MTAAAGVVKVPAVLALPAPVAVSAQAAAVPGSPESAKAGESASAMLASQLANATPGDAGPVVQNGHSRPVVANAVMADSTPASSSTASNAAAARPPAPDFSDSEGARFWQPACQSFFDVYLERKLQDIVRILSKLDVSHWRQLLEFRSQFSAFLKQPSHQTVPAPPALPAELFAFLLSAYVSGDDTPPMAPSTSEPFWYLEAVLLLRLLLRPSQSKSDSDAREQGFSAPSRLVQFLVHLSSSSSTASLLLTAGSHGAGAAWARHGGDLLLNIQRLIAQLYLMDAGTKLWTGPRSPLLSEEMPSMMSIVAETALQFSAHLLIAGSPESRLKQGDALSSEPVQQELQGGASSSDSVESSEPLAPQPSRSSHFATIMRCVLNLSQPATAALRIGDRFLLCLRDVLHLHLGPAPSTPDNLPEPVAPLGPVEDKKDENAEQEEEPVDIKALARIVRTVLQAHSTDPALLDAREVGRQQQAGAKVQPHSSQAGLFVGSFAGPSEPGDFVSVTESGPLRRSLAFMEQSALLHVVQSKLLAARFADVVGSTDQLSSFALRNLRVLWFDLRRCTSTLKRAPSSTNGETDTLPAAQSRITTAMLVLRNLRLGLEHDWAATLATFPYFSLSGGSRVTVKSLVISVHIAFSHETGVELQEVEVGRPELDIQLSCSSTFSQMVLSVVLAILQASLQEHIQKQLRKHLLNLLEQEMSKWNQTMWKPMTWVVPEHLIASALAWLSKSMPPEGLPI